MSSVTFAQFQKMLPLQRPAPDVHRTFSRCYARLAGLSECSRSWARSLPSAGRGVPAARAAVTVAVAKIITRQMFMCHYYGESSALQLE